ncbi:unnamed protein product [Haemonchus placei]|uniref:Secreted protein n=1 Tax=Haemonchus placei TaxID=6290 RepID=A0A0N4WCF1_HAEPC|nr:unnamed protein product [Haemonchus placei]
MRPTAFIVWLLYVLVESKWIHVKVCFSRILEFSTTYAAVHNFLKSA